MISAMGQEVMVKEAILYGAKSFIVKPYKEEQVIETYKSLRDGLTFKREGFRWQNKTPRSIGRDVYFRDISDCRAS